MRRLFVPDSVTERLTHHRLHQGDDCRPVRACPYSQPAGKPISNSGCGIPELGVAHRVGVDVAGVTTTCSRGPEPRSLQAAVASVPAPGGTSVLRCSRRVMDDDSGLDRHGPKGKSDARSLQSGSWRASECRARPLLTGESRHATTHGNTRREVARPASPPSHSLARALHSACRR